MVPFAEKSIGAFEAVLVGVSELAAVPVSSAEVINGVLVQAEAVHVP